MISKHITYEEATKSQTAVRRGIDNTPNAQQLEAMKLVAEKIFEPIREHFGIPIAITSFYRSPALNKAVGGAKNSQHVLGEAIDIDGQVLGGVSNSTIYKFVKDNLAFDQLIWEYGNAAEPDWVHVSYRKSGNRNQVVRVG